MTDPHADDPIGALLRGLADPPGVDDTWHVVLARSGQARRRRRATRLAGATGAAVVVGALLATVSLRPADRLDVVVDPASQPTAEAGEVRPAVTTSSNAPSPTDRREAGSVSDPVAIASGGIDGPTSTSAPVEQPAVLPPTTAEVAAGGDGSVPSASGPAAPAAAAPPMTTTPPVPTVSTSTPPRPSPSSPAPTATPTSTPTTAAPSSTVPAVETFTYRLAGGVAVVGWNGSRLSLVSTTPAAGYRLVVDHAGPGEIELSFVGGGRASVLHVELEDGRPSPEISER